MGRRIRPTGLRVDPRRLPLFTWRGGESKQELGRFSQHCARGREPFSSGEKFGETASLHFDRQLSRTLQIARNPRGRGNLGEYCWRIRVMWDWLGKRRDLNPRNPPEFTRSSGVHLKLAWPREQF